MGGEGEKTFAIDGCQDRVICTRFLISYVS